MIEWICFWLCVAALAWWLYTSRLGEALRLSLITIIVPTELRPLWLLSVSVRLRLFADPRAVWFARLFSDHALKHRRASGLDVVHVHIQKDGRQIEAAIYRGGEFLPPKAFK